MGEPTLTRFFILHFLLPFTILGLVLVHIVALHDYESRDPLGLESGFDKVPFHPYFRGKDLTGFVVALRVFLVMVLAHPWVLGEADNFMEANPLVTPAHIKPEWYFLFAYAVLRSIPNKLGGVIALLASVLVVPLLAFFGPVRGGVNVIKLRKALF